ncbi:19546_t:CDS:1, partial [Cetraspora pellucida]
IIRHLHEAEIILELLYEAAIGHQCYLILIDTNDLHAGPDSALILIKEVINVPIDILGHLTEVIG